MPAERRRILVVDDDASRHADVRAWIERLGFVPDVHGQPPSSPAEGPAAAAVVIHAGYGRKRPGFPRADRRAEAVRWFLDDPSYLFHEDLEAFGDLGRALGPDCALVVITGGSGRDVPAEELRRLAGARPLACWNVMDLVGTQSLEEALAGPGRRPGDGADAGRVASEVRHDLLNRLWNMALAAGEDRPDAVELAEIVEGDDDQSRLTVLVAAADGLGASTREALERALERALEGQADGDLAELSRRAIQELEGR